MWIRARFNFTSSQVHVSIKTEVIEELREYRVLAWDLLSKNLAPVKKVRTFAGKCSHVAGLILYWHLVVAMVWAALTDLYGPSAAR
eukprot:1654489-Amphidinium_carterae.5